MEPPYFFGILNIESSTGALNSTAATDISTVGFPLMNCLTVCGSMTPETCVIRHLGVERLLGSAHPHIDFGGRLQLEADSASRK